MSKKKQTILSVIGVLVLVVAVFGVSRAFFNYTRTGSANIVRTGRINFNSTQSGILTLTNAFPMTSNEALASGNNTLSIRVYGDTTYSGGIEYLLTAEDVNIRTTTGKKVPLSIVASVTGNGLGTPSTTGYFTTDRGHTTSYYKLLNEDVIEPGEYLLVGYIAPGQAGVDGTINITAYLDKDEIAISDTYDWVVSDNMGTTSEWVDGRVVLTTSEWNSLTGNNALSFKVRVESNEGIWVGNPTSRNDMKNISGTTVFTSAQKSSITEIHFVKMPEERINSHANVIDLTAVNGQGVVKGWIEGTKLYIASPGETYFPQNSNGLFYNYTNVTKIEFNNVNTSSVTSMSGMFQNCTSLTTLDLSSFDTSNVTNMGGMFYNCASLTTLDLSSLNTSSVTEMGGMVSNCTNLQSINLSGLGGNNLANSSMFNNNINLTKINMSNFNFGTQTSLSGFYGSTPNVRELYLKDANTSNVTNMTAFLSSLQNLEIVDLTGMDTSNVTNMTAMFYGDINLTEIRGLETLDTSKVQNMSVMFQNCESLTSLSLSNFDTSSVMYMSGMFNNCTSLTTLDLSSFNTSSVTDMGGMFNNCTSLTTLDLSSFDTRNVTTMGGMFAMGTYSGNTWTPNNNKLKTIIVSEAWDTSNISSSPLNMFYNCTHLVGGNGTVFNSDIIDAEYARIDRASVLGYLTLSPDSQRNVMHYLGYSNGVTKIVFKYMKSSEMETAYNAASLKMDATLTGENNGRVLVWLSSDPDNYGKYIMTVASNGTTYFSTGEGLFAGFQDLQSIEFNNVDTSMITNAKNMFVNCKSLTSIDLRAIDTSNVLSMFTMFYGCSNLTSINLSVINTSKVTNMSTMFYDCSSLTSINLSGIDTSNVTTMYQMFYNCSSLTDIDLSALNTSKVTNMSNMFYDCSSLTHVNLSGLGGNELNSIGGIFIGDSSLKEINMSNFNFGKITSLASGSSPFYQLFSIEKINLSNSNASNVTNMSEMFKGLYKLENIDLSNMITGNVTNMSYMFSVCRALSSLNFTNIDTSHVSTMEKMFNDCGSLIELDLSSFDTKGLDSSGMVRMFNACTRLVTIYVSDLWDSSKQASTLPVFENSSSLVGGAGTRAIDAVVNTASYAHIDGGTANPGYLTRKTN